MEVYLTNGYLSHMAAQKPKNGFMTQKGKVATNQEASQMHKTLIHLRSSIYHVNTHFSHFLKEKSHKNQKLRPPSAAASWAPSDCVR